MKHLLVIVYVFVVYSAHSQGMRCETWKKERDSFEKELKECQNRYDRISRSEYAKDAKIEKLQTENDSLRAIIHSGREQRVEHDSIRKMKENKILILDPAFKSFLLKCHDINDDGEISQYEAEFIVNLTISKQKISSLEGIEYFTCLEKLVCSKNNLTRLDLTKNTSLRTLIFDNNLISFLDISNCLNLNVLDCSYNKLTNLDLNGNPKLKTLNCANNLISTINVSNCEFLRTIECQRNSISKLDVSTNTNLTYLNCSSNKLVLLSVEDNKFLTKLNCSYNYLTILNVKNGSNFDLLDCRYNPKLSEVRISSVQRIHELKKNRKTFIKKFEQYISK